MFWSLKFRKRSHWINELYLPIYEYFQIWFEEIGFFLLEISVSTELSIQKHYMSFWQVYSIDRNISLIHIHEQYRQCQEREHTRKYFCRSKKLKVEIEQNRFLCVRSKIYSWVVFFIELIESIEKKLIEKSSVPFLWIWVE